MTFRDKAIDVTIELRTWRDKRQQATQLQGEALKVSQPERLNAEASALLESALAARDNVVSALYDALSSMSASKLAREGQTDLHPTDLAHMAFLRIDRDMKSFTGEIRDRGYFLFAAARAIRQLLLEHARRSHPKGTQAKGVFGHKTLNEVLLDVGEDYEYEEILSVNQSLEKLRGLHDLQYQVIFLKYWAGLKMKDIALALDISQATAERHHAKAKKWLRAVLSYKTARR